MRGPLLRFGRLLAGAALAAGAAALASDAPKPEMPFVFEQNVGHANPEIRFLARRAGVSLLFASNATILRLASGQEVRWRFTGTSPQAGDWQGENAALVEINSFVGQPSRWRRNIPAFTRLRRANLYPAVDMVAYGKPGSKEQFEYDLIAKPGANVRDIRWEIAGDAAASIDRTTGDIVIRHGRTEFRHRKPVAYQVNAAGIRTPVEARYRALGGRPAARGVAAFGIETGPYDRTLPLVIDPVWTLARYFGGSGDDTITSLGPHSVCGYSASVDMPGMGIQERTGIDGFTFTGGGAGVGVLTYFGGSGDDKPLYAGIVGNGIVVVGETTSRDFPTGVIQTKQNDSSVREYSYGQSSYGGGASDGFVFDMRWSFAGLIMSSYFGGSGADRLTWAGPHRNGRSAMVAGETDSPGFLGDSRGGIDGFVAEIGNTLAVLASERFGGTGNESVVFASPDLVAGSTSSGADFAGSGPSKGGVDVYIRLQDPVLFSSRNVLRYGGAGDDFLRNGTVPYWPPESLRIQLCGSTSSRDLPVALPFQKEYGGGASDGFYSILKLSPGEPQLLQSSYFGGTGEDEIRACPARDAQLVVAGSTSSRDLPLVDASQSAYGGGVSDGFVAVLEHGRLIASSYAGGPGEDLIVSVVAGGQGYYAWGWTDTGFGPAQGTFGRRAYAGGRDLFMLDIKVTEDTALVAAPGLRNYVDIYNNVARYRTSNPEKLLLSTDGVTWGPEAGAPGDFGSYRLWFTALSDEGFAEIEPLPPATMAAKFYVQLAPASVSVIANPGVGERTFLPANPVVLPTSSSTTLRMQFAALHPQSGRLVPLGPRVSVDPMQLTTQNQEILEGPILWDPTRAADVTVLTGSRAGRTQLVVPPVPGILDSATTIPIETVHPTPILNCPPRIGPGGYDTLTIYAAGLRHSKPVRIEISPATVARIGSWNGTEGAINPGINSLSIIGAGETGNYTITASGEGLQTVTQTCTVLPFAFVPIGSTISAPANTTFDALANLAVLTADGRPVSFDLSPQLLGGPAPLELEYTGPLEGPSRYEYVRGSATRISIPVKAGAAGRGTIRYRLAAGRGPEPNPYTVQEVLIQGTPPLTMGSPLVGKDLLAPVALNATGATSPIRINSADPSRVLLSPDAETPGAAEIQLNATSHTNFYVHALSDRGEVPVTATSGSTSVTTSIRLARSFVSVAEGRADVLLRLWELPRNFAIRYLTEGALDSGASKVRPGLDPGLRLSSSDPGMLQVSTGEPAPGPIDANDTVFQLVGLRPGRGRLRLESQSFRVEPSSVDIPFEIVAPQFSLNNAAVPYNAVVGVSLTDVDNVVRRIPAGTRFQVRSSDPSRVLLSTNPGVPGTESIEVNGSDSTVAGFQLHGLHNGDSTAGDVNLLIETAGIRLAPVRVVPVASSFVFLPWQWLNASVNSNTTSTSLSLRYIEPATGRLSDRQVPVRPGIPDVEVALLSRPEGALRSNPARVSFPSGTSAVPLTVTLAPGFTPTGSGFELVASAPGFAQRPESTLRAVPPQLDPLRIWFSTDGRFSSNGVGQGQINRFSVQMNRPSTEPVSFTIQSSDPSILMLSTTDTMPGVAAITGVIRPGDLSTNVYLQSTGPTGSASLTLTAPQPVTVVPGTDSNLRVTVSPSWLEFAPDSRMALLGQAFELRLLQRVRLLSSNDYAIQLWTPRPGFPETFLPLSVSPPGALELPAAGISSSKGVVNVVGLRPGAATVTLTAQPEGFVTPPSPPRIDVQITVPTIRAQAQIREMARDEVTSVYLATSGIDTLRIRSADPARLLLSTQTNVAGQPELNVSTQSSNGTLLYVHVLAQDGTVSFTASGPNAEPFTMTIPVRPAAFVLTAESENMLAGASMRGTVTLLRSNAAGEFTSYTLRPGATHELRFQSSDTQVVGLNPSTIAIRGDGFASYFAGPSFQAVAPGTARVTLTQPLGFGPLPPLHSGGWNVTVTEGIATVSLPRVASNMRSTATIRLTPAPTVQNPVTVRVTTLDPGVLQVAGSLVSPSQGSVELRVERDSAAFFVDGMGGGAPGSSTRLRIEAPGYRTIEIDATLNPSGFVFATQSGTAQTGVPYSLQVSLVPLTNSTLQPLPVQGMTLSPSAGDVALTIASSNPAVGLSGSPAVFPATTGTIPLTLRFAAPGTTTLTIETPPGFAKPLSAASQTVVVR
jgi:hypothetical protein